MSRITRLFALCVFGLLAFAASSPSPKHELVRLHPSNVGPAFLLRTDRATIRCTLHDLRELSQHPEQRGPYRAIRTAQVLKRELRRVEPLFAAGSDYTVAANSREVEMIKNLTLVSDLLYAGLCSVRDNRSESLVEEIRVIPWVDRPRHGRRFEFIDGTRFLKVFDGMS